MTQDELERRYQDNREFARDQMAWNICSHALNKNFMELINKWMERDRLPPFMHFTEVVCAASKYIAYQESLPPLLDPSRRPKSASHDGRE
jgi:hypothetical protein